MGADTDFRVKWIHDDCEVRECIDGFISYDDKGYSTVARCPRCDRADAALPHGIPSLRTYTGRISLRNREEMAIREEERRGIVTENFFDRLARAKESLEKAKEIAGGTI